MSLELKKECACTGVLLYALKEFIAFARENGMECEKETALYKKVKKASLEHFYDEKEGLFICENQISYATNVWMVLGGVLSQKKAQEALRKLEERKYALKPVTPYMMHHYIVALIENKEEKRHDIMVEYWGEMVKEKADTFYELFNPSNPKASPYGSASVNSYCHAWSCTPSYLLRKYFRR